MLKPFKVATLILALSTLHGCATDSQHQALSKESKYKIVKTFTEKQEARPTIIVAHGCESFTDGGPTYKEWAAQINSWGYNAIIIDNFTARGYSSLCTNVNAWYVPPRERADDFIELAKEIRKQPWHKGNIGVIGFSHGGSSVINLASRTDQKEINFAIAYYPNCYVPFVGVPVDDFKIPIQFHLGEKDDWTTYTQCLSKDKNADQHVYVNATHAFDMNYPARKYQGHWLAYDKKADVTSRQRTRDFIEKMTLTKK